MSQTLTVIGNIASGKSTLMPILQKALDAKTIDADNLFQTTDPFAKPYLADMKRWAFANELWLTHERVKIMREETKKNGHPITIVDSGLLMSWVYTHSHLLVGNITEEEWSLYKNVYDELTHGMFQNTHVVKLSYSMDTLMERLKKRGRDYELAFYTREYLGQIELGLSALVEKLTEHGVTIIDVAEDQAPDFEADPKVADAIIERVKKHIER